MSGAGQIRGWQPPRRRPRRIWYLTALLPLAAALLLLPMKPGRDALVQSESLPVLAEGETFALPSSVMLGLPESPVQRLTVTNERLVNGRMLLIDAEHPLPEGAVPGNTFGVLSYARGRIACRDPQAVLGEETLIRLEYLCVDARNSGMDRLTVFAGTRSQEQQRILLTDTVADFARDVPIEEAVALAKEKVDAPGCSEHQLPWTVDIRLCRTWNDMPAREALADSPQGSWLLENAWRYGFVQRWPEADPAVDDHRPYHFRYVGLAHARMMRALGLDFEGYLTFLRQEGAVTLLDDEGAPLVTAVCVRAGERHTIFEVPEGTKLEDASLDNTGWALLSLTYR